VRTIFRLFVAFFAFSLVAGAVTSEYGPADALTLGLVAGVVAYAAIGRRSSVAGSSFSPLRAGEEVDDPVAIGRVRLAIRDAIDKACDVAIDYQAPGEEPVTHRRITPLDIEDGAYLIGFCHLRDAERTFKLSRIQDIRHCERYGRGRRAWARWQKQTGATSDNRVPVTAD